MLPDVDPESAAPADADPSAGAPSTRDIRPRAAWYWIGAAVLVLGLAGAAGWFVSSVVAAVNVAEDHQRVSVPGERTLTFAEPGQYTIYGETTEYVSYAADLVTPTVTVKTSSGTPVPVDDTYTGNYTPSSSYTWNGYRGYTLATVDIPASGSYVVSVSDLVVRDSGASGGAGGGPSGGTRRTTTTYSYTQSYSVDVARIAVGKSTNDRAVAGIFGSLGLGALAAILGTVILIVTGVKRSGSRKRLFPPPARPYAYAGGGFPPPPGAGMYPSPYGARPGYPPSGPPPYGPAPYGPSPYGPAPYGPAPYGPSPYGPAAYGPNPYGGPTAGPNPSGPPRAAPYGPPPAAPYGPPPGAGYGPAPTAPNGPYGPLGGPPAGPPPGGSPGRPAGAAGPPGPAGPFAAPPGGTAPPGSPPPDGAWSPASGPPSGPPIDPRAAAPFAPPFAPPGAGDTGAFDPWAPPASADPAFVEPPASAIPDTEPFEPPPADDGDSGR